MVSMQLFAWYGIGFVAIWIAWGWALFLRSIDNNGPTNRLEWLRELVWVLVWPATIAGIFVMIVVFGLVAPVIGYLDARDFERETAPRDTGD